MRAQLKGKSSNVVVATLGKPVKVYSFGLTESWAYTNAVFDPISGRTVRNLEFWFRNGVVDYMNASF